MMSSPLLLRGILERAAKLFPNVELMSVRADGSRHRSNYLETQRRAKQLSAALLQAGIRNGDRVATLMWNQQEHVEAYFGVPGGGRGVAYLEPAAASGRNRLHR
jgi:fatty-acyl-CoA synthase